VLAQVVADCAVKGDAMKRDAVKRDARIAWRIAAGAN
jgi:hypothetical protein